MKKYFLALFAMFSIASLSTAQFSTFPVEWTFENGANGWTIVDRDGEQPDNWYISQGDNDSATFRVQNYQNNYGAPPTWYSADEWLVSPAISVNSDGLVFEYFMRTYRAHYQIFVGVNSNSVDTMLANGPVIDTILTNCPNCNTITKMRQLDLADYYGQTIYIAIRYTSDGSASQSWIRLFKTGVREPNRPHPQLGQDTIVDISNPINLKVHLIEGSEQGLDYTWTSTMVTGGVADITANYDSASITYAVTGVDTIVVTANNDFGTSSDTIIVRVVNFQPATVPYTCSFEDANHGWITFNASNAWYVGAHENHPDNNVLYISSDGLSNNYSADASISYAVRAIDLTESGTYQYSYDWQCLGRGGMIDLMGVYFTTDLGFIDSNKVMSMTSWYNCGTHYGSAEWRRQSGVVSLNAGRVYAVIRWRNLSDVIQYGMPAGPSASVDNFTLHTMTCSTPSNLHVTAITPNSISIAWTAENSETQWAYSINDYDYFAIGTNPYTITGLSPNTQYTVSVKAICNVGDTSAVIRTTVSTPCTPISTLPWSESFSDFLSYPSGFNTCWIRGIASNDVDMPEVRTVDGDNVLYMQCYNSPNWIENAYSYVILPTFSIPYNDLRMSFDMRGAGLGTAKVVIGLIDTFGYNEANVAIDTVGVYENSTSAWQTFTADFTGHNTGANGHIIIITDTRFENNIQQSNQYIDNIEVYDSTSCLHPNHLTIEAVGLTDVYLSWQHLNNAGQYSLSYRPVGEDNWTTIDVFETSTHIEDLDEATRYEVMVQASCGDGVLSNPTVIEFHTLCQTDATDYSESFEGDGISCWSVLAGTTWTDVVWHSTRSQASDGATSMMSASCYSFFGPIDEWLISPALIVPANANTNLSLSWYGRNPSRNGIGGQVNDEPYLVLANIDGTYNDKSMYTDTLAEVVGDNEWTRHMVNIGQYAGHTIHIAFVHNVCSDIGNDNAVYIDNIVTGLYLAPVVELNGHEAANIGISEVYSANILEGVSTDVVYQWSSSMLTRGHATEGESNDDAQLVLTYQQEGIDTIVIVANNLYGTSRDTLIVTVRNLHTITTLPYHTGFEPTDDNGNWVMTGTDDLNWYIDNATANEGSQSLYVSYNGGIDNDYQIGANRVYAFRGLQIDESGDYTISFDWRCNGFNAAAGTTHGSMNVSLVQANTPITGGSPLVLQPGDMSFTTQGSTNFNNNNEWQRYTVNLNIESGLYILVFSWTNIAGGTPYNPAAAVDNLTIKQLTCYPPTELEVRNLNYSSATLAWSSNAGETAWEVTINNNAPVIVQNTPVYTMTGLVPSTTYIVSVRTICSPGDTSTAVTIGFTTECGIISEMPWSEDFSGYNPSSTEIDIACWMHLGGGVVTTTRSQSVGGGTDVSLCPKPLSNRDSVSINMLLPNFYFPTRYLELSFYLLADGTDAGGIEVGYLTMGDDISSFVPVRAFTPDEATTFTQFTVSFPEAQGNERIVIRRPYGNQYHQMCTNNWFIDNVMVDTLEGCDLYNCRVPSNLTVTNIANGIYRLEWTPGSDEHTWSVQRVHGSDTVSATAIDNPSRLYSDMIIGETYSFRVKAICSQLAESDWSEFFTYEATQPEDPGHDGIGNVESVLFGLHPNPATSNITIDLSSLAGTVMVDIFDLDGRTIMQTSTANDNLQVDITTYARGTYFVRATCAQGTSVRKLIVQ